ncbi:hypothetical protein WR25_15318 [Diploscapter pachys]|uniref:Exonuclease domain-containing protein n=1 Tax=Diploscapter pachys TaxID=2018661 RepID=A0A2A2JCD7_9BILA|nr:hypothetical protein WR25_13531 [Diploscapter pachys]PAV74703.1 hypothetical protein WR25_15318 [Diploscapter pachys]
MVYTMDGPALARVTVVDIHNNPKLDEIVRPPSEVIDCNTKYSGITMDMIQKATETLTSIQSRLFEFINSETILIGHSLESDLKTLRIIHSNVVDTAVLFMGGRPQKPSLANLASDLLMRFIQQDEPGQVGHSSLEDSIVCMDLVLLKIGFKKRAI